MVIRAVYFGVALQLFGSLIFAWLVAAVPRRGATPWLATIALLAMAAWLPLETVMMSGAPLSIATSPGHHRPVRAGAP